MASEIASHSAFGTSGLVITENPTMENSPDRAQSVPFLLEGKERQGEGGLRTKGHFRRSPEDTPKLTVISVSFNCAHDIEETILSVLKQTYSNIEYIIIDGGSTDGTLDVLRKYEYAIDYWVSEPDRGIYDAMNKGICLARGEWLNFMNAGDLFSGGEIVKEIFTEPANYLHNDFIYSDILFRYRSGLYRYQCDIHKRLVVHQAIMYRKLLHTLSGYYVVADNLTISDYFFFMINRGKKWFKFDTPISTFNPYGVSSGLATFRQKVAVDIMLGLMGRIQGSLLLLAHPVYDWFRRLLQRCGALPG